METEAAEAAGKDLGSMDDEELSSEIESRNEAMERWQKVYWEDFIPFAHGVRLFGQVYNDRHNPEDPFEFIDLLAAVPLKSMERNRKLADLASMIARASGLEGIEKEKAEDDIEQSLESLVGEFAGLSCSMAACDDEKESLRSIAAEMSGIERPGNRNRRGQGRDTREESGSRPSRMKSGSCLRTARTGARELPASGRR